MPSALDLRLEAAYNLITGPGGPIQIGSVERFGQQLPFIANAPTNLADYVAFFAAQHGDATFLVEGEERLSFKQVYVAARQVAAGLVDGYGVQRGDRVGLAMRNANAWCVTYIGILMAGGCATLLNGWWQGGELAAGIADSEAKLVIADVQRAARLDGIAHDAKVVTLDITRPIGEAIAPIADKGGADTVLPTLTGQDLATILFTSGSTGQSKGAYSRHEAVCQAIFNYVTQTASIVHLLTEDGQMSDIQPATLICTPLFHVTAEIPVFLQSFALGRKLVLMPKWNAEEAMRLIQDEQCNYFVGVPLMSYEILIHPNRKNYDLSTCKSYAGGGAPRPPEHVKRLATEMGEGKPLLGYGLTETNAVGCGIINENYLAKPMSTGPASKPLVDLAILDDDGNPVAQGGVGEVCIRSVCNFEGYWNNEAATKAAFFDNGYFRSGDLGYLDEDGYLFIVDRKKDIIIRGGENISCQEVEAAIYEHPDTNECAVFGLPDERLGECVGAVVWMKPGSSVTADDLTAFLGSRLAPYKVPCQIWMSSDALPKLGSEKIDKVGLRTQYREEYAAKVVA
ncbi:class I adenylate-forming enzyme family protein [Sphingopyxis sp. RIFCSPHIGHO2_12_FULL_65_19]|uniref:class I adenylate-forming enzyme family protein n=1 Tax=Sphingopyxis sp. RIFCSPHIGHO2_12_FULL_65_19 TaxID=1802172 RepID=UPI0008BF8650|nr:class I adenylate-forming enzyme family protein [Sphingopyxis sp. RIFCSPHIGHO2_12_FULL_65_19]OHD04343.1 MAG: AMP-dependent synthetase [Sphingopyxis sp. RIFCSPHIGHO2_12_FULL_65_19]